MTDTDKSRVQARVNENDEYRDLRYWDQIFSRPVIAAVTSRTIPSVGQWSYSGVPYDAQMLLRLYSGEISMGEWEDDVEANALKMAEKHYSPRYVSSMKKDRRIALR